MRTRLALLGAVAALALGVAGPAAESGFRYGVAAGEVTSSSALLWTRADGSGRVTLELSPDRRFGRAVVRRPVNAKPSNDNTVQVKVTGLKPAKRYFYRFRRGRAVSALGRFETAPSPTSSATVEFAFSGDADGTPVPGSGKPFFNRFEVYARMAAEGNDFNVNLGDTIYSDSGVAGPPPAVTIRQKWAKYKENLALPNLVRLRGSAALYSHWDDHEFVNDFSIPEHGRALYEAGVEAFTDYAPVSYLPRDGLYRSFRWGKNLELFFLDERSFRDAKASAGGVCNTGGSPDLAPTAPQPVREAFSALAPSLAQPVAQACLDRIRDPARTLLGRRQLARFTAAIKRSTATFKVIMNETPIQQFYALPYDRWEGYEAERLRLIEFLRANVKNVVFLTTDTHANLVGDVRLRTLEPGGPVDSGIIEVVTGPVATNTYSREVDAVLGRPGTGDAVTALFLKPAPPRGIGMRCAATDVYSYAQVKVTAKALTVTLKDSKGRLVREKTGDPCGPFTIGKT